MRLGIGDCVYPVGDELADLLTLCLKGDQRALTELYHAYASDVYRLVYGLLGDREDAEEVVQDTFMYALQRLNRYDPDRAGFRTWLYIIATSRARNKRRRKWLPTISLRFILESKLGLTGSSLTRPPEDKVETLVREERVRNALDKLSTKLREAAVLKYFNGMTYKEIGQILDIPKKTAESRVRLAHRALRELMKDE